MEKFIKEMPKIELHAHLNGCLTTDVLLELGSLKYGNTTEEFKRLCQGFTSLGSTLDECFKKFKIAHDLTSSAECLKKAVLCVIEDFAKDNVIYVELRTTPKETKQMSKKKYLETVLDAIRSAQSIHPQIDVVLLPSFDRAQGIEQAESSLKIILDLQHDNRELIKGLDFSGNPAAGEFNIYKGLLETARNAGLKLALHCGEIDNEDEITEMLDFSMSRCGHGTFIKGDNFKRLKDENIPVECCLSSNVKCGTVPSFDDHHFKDLLRNKNMVTLCTDDFGVFDTTLSKEFEIAFKTFNLEKNDLYLLSMNAIASSFADDNLKQKLKDRVQKYFDENEI